MTEVIVDQRPEVRKKGKVEVWLVDISDRRDVFSVSVAAGCRIATLKEMMAAKMMVPETDFFLYKDKSKSEKIKVHHLNSMESIQLFYEGMFLCLTFILVILMYCYSVNGDSSKSVKAYIVSKKGNGK